MALEMIFPGVHSLTLGPVNVFLIEDGDRLVVLDTGIPGSADAILAAARDELGYGPQDIAAIVITHSHPDHVGGLNALQQATGAAALAHPLDAEVTRGDVPIRDVHPSPGILNYLLYILFVKIGGSRFDKAPIHTELHDGQVLPISGGLRVIHTPGHSSGHCAFLLERDGGLLFVADACSNMGGLGLSVVYEDLEEGKRSLAHLAELEPQVICFGHGKPITGRKIRRFRRKWRST